METKNNGSKLLQKTADRRSFLKGVSVAGLGLAGGALMASTTPAEGQTASNGLTANDVAVLNFALNLEYLEAEFYTKAFYGLTLEQFGIPTDGVGLSGLTTGGEKVQFDDGFFDDKEFSGRLRAVAKEIAYDEQTHVKLLRSVLGPLAVAKAPINLDAMGKGFANFKQFLSLARDFEDVGVSAYGGAVGLLSSATLPTAARVALTEAYHASNLRLLCAENHVQSLPVDGLDFPPPPTGSKYFDVDDEGLAIVRTTSQVLSIVYANSAPGTSEGGFFPKGFNGAIKTV